jgi:hypothetical protein
MPRKFKTNQRKKLVVKTSSVNSRYIDKMRREGTPVGSNEWTKRRAIENAIERAKDAEAQRKKLERKNKPPGKKPNW